MTLYAPAVLCYNIATWHCWVHTKDEPPESDQSGSVPCMHASATPVLIWTNVRGLLLETYQANYHYRADAVRQNASLASEVKNNTG